MILEPIKFVGEIIQIGAVRMDGALKIEDTLDIMIKPIYYTVMHSRVEDLTGIDEADLEEGVSFSEAYKRFMEFCGEDFCLMTWGGDDIRILTSNMTVHNLPFPAELKSYNLQRVYGKQIAKEKKQIALETAVEALGEPPYDAHNALNDAMSTARVCRHLDLKQEKMTVRHFRQS